MPFLMYRNNDLGLQSSSYPCILGSALNEYRINTSVIIYYINKSKAMAILILHNLGYILKCCFPYVTNNHAWPAFPIFLNDQRTSKDKTWQHLNKI